MTQEIRDPIHKDVVLSENEIKLMGTYEFQRLRKIRQLGLIYLVYPGAHNTRFEHSLGVRHCIEKIVRCSNLRERIKDDNIMDELYYAALLHDIGHPAYTHVVENLVRGAMKHEKITRDLITGRSRLDIDTDLSRVNDVLKEIGADIGKISDILSGDHYLSSLISGNIDADKLDYLVRDSYYCGVNYGVYDDRIFSCFRIISDDEKNKIIMKNKPDSIGSILTVLTSRYNMRKRVYEHHTVAAADEMLITAIERALGDVLFEEDLYILGDYEVLERLKRSTDTVTKTLARRIEGRDLYKRAYVVDYAHRSRTLEETIDRIKKSRIEKANYIERIIDRISELARQRGDIERLEEHDILLHFPRPSLYTDIQKLDAYRKETGEVSLINLPDASPHLHSLRTLFDHLWTFYVFTSKKENQDLVIEACGDVFKASSSYGGKIRGVSVTIPPEDVSKKLNLVIEEIENKKRVSLNPIKVLLKENVWQTRDQLADELKIKSTTVSQYLSAIKQIENKHGISLLSFKRERRKKYWMIDTNVYDKLKSILREKEYGF